MSEGNGRRWGRVTVEGWISEEPLASAGNLVVSPTRDGVGQSFFYPGSNSELVFLPEPVQFKDGDVVRAVINKPLVYVRGANAWTVADEPHGRYTYSDETVAGWLSRREAVRLVPEANQ